MRRPGFLAPLLVAAAVVTAVAPVQAGSIDDAGSQLVVPLVVYTARETTRLFVENHEPTSVEVIVRYVGALGSATPGVQICMPSGNNPVISANRVVEFDLSDPATSGCALNGNDHGMVVLVAKDRNSIARLSARARIDLEDPAFPTRGQTFMVDGIPLANLDTTRNVHVAAPVRHDPPGGAGGGRPAAATDCFVGTFFPANASNTTTDAWLEPKDGAGNALGSGPLHVNLQPLEFAMITDVFSRVGAPPMPQDDARVEFRFLGGGNNVLGFCRTMVDNASSGQAQGPTFAYQIARVAEPLDEARRRRAGAASTPGSGPFMMKPSESRSLHGLYVRHPDIVTCMVASAGVLDIKAVSPDGAFSFPGVSGLTPEFGSPLGGYQGASGIWGIEISWSPGADRSRPVTYAINCMSGNGTSLVDDLTN